MRQAGIAALSGRPLRDFSTTVRAVYTYRLEYGELSMDQDDAAGACRPRYIKLNARDTRCRKRAQNGVG
jgi:hypothetical protein